MTQLESADEWDDPDFQGECDMCGLLKPLKTLPDPFVSEVYPEEKADERDYCYACFCNRKDDI